MNRNDRIWISKPRPVRHPELARPSIRCIYVRTIATRAGINWLALGVNRHGQYIPPQIY
jgi:hypothetical protein